MFIEYSIYNSVGVRYIFFVGASIFLSVLRNTLARVLTLIVGMGLGITNN